MNPLTFTHETPPPESAPNRVDIALFVGFVRRRGDARTPAALVRRLRENGWLEREQTELLSEARGETPLADAVAIAADEGPLLVRFDDLTHEVRFEPGLYSHRVLLDRLNRGLPGGYARLVDGLLTIGADGGDAAEVEVGSFAALGFPRPQRGGRVEAAPDLSLLDVPLPIDRWDLFDLLFDWRRRTPDSQQSTYLGAAVRSFFAQGGRRCYVVRVGDPWPSEVEDPDLPADQAAQARSLRLHERMANLLPGFPHELAVNAAERGAWSGVGHVYGLPDVTFVSMPDLTDIVAPPLPRRRPPQAAPRSLPETFVECSQSPATVQGDVSTLQQVSAPRCDKTGLDAWVRAIHLTAELLSRSRREMQLIASAPLLRGAQGDEPSPFATLLADGAGPLARGLTSGDGIASAFLQLAYPWLRTPGSNALPERLEPPEGALIGLLARNALTRGTFRHAGQLTTGDILEVEPILTAEQLQQRVASRREGGRSMLERVSLFGPTPDGLRLLSDVTTSLDESHRSAGVNRLIGSLLRAARGFGEDAVFEPSGRRLWRTLREQLHELLLGLYLDGAFQGENPGEAFNVRCDRSTMSRNDLDNGRVVAEVRVRPAAAIEQITVVLTLDDGGLTASSSQREVA